MSERVPPAIEAIFTAGLDGIGERLVRTLVENLDKSDRTPLAMLTRSALHPRPVRDAAPRVHRPGDHRPAGSVPDTPDAPLRYIVPIEPIATRPPTSWQPASARSCSAA